MIDAERLWTAVLEQAIIDLTKLTDAHLTSAGAFDTSPSYGSLRTIMSLVHFSGFAKALILMPHGFAAGFLHSSTLRQFLVARCSGTHRSTAICELRPRFDTLD